MKNLLKIRVPKVDISSWKAHEMNFDPFWAELLVVPQKSRKCKLVK